MNEKLFYPGLKGKTAIITGGAVNIGKSLSLAFAASGAHIALVYHDSREAATTLVDKIKAEGGYAAPFKVDIRNENEVEAFFRNLNQEAKFQGEKILVNNSGIFSLADQTTLSAGQWKQIFDVNVTGLFLFCREAAKGMKKNKAGVIVNIASINALHPGFGMTAHYDASKGAVAAYTKSLAAELGPWGIRVNAIAPGLVDSPRLRETAKELALMVEKRNPLKGPAGQGQLVKAMDIAQAALFLASGAARSITGEILIIDRGYLLS